MANPLGVQLFDVVSTLSASKVVVSLSCGRNDNVDVSSSSGGLIGMT